MPQHDVSDEEEAATATLELILMDGELALLALSLVEVLRGWKFDLLSADLEDQRFQLLFDLVTWGHHLTEVVVSDAVNIMNSFLPFFLQE